MNDAKSSSLEIVSRTDTIQTQRHASTLHSLFCTTHEMFNLIVKYFCRVYITETIHIFTQYLNYSWNMQSQRVKYVFRPTHT